MAQQNNKKLVSKKKKKKEKNKVCYFRKRVKKKKTVGDRMILIGDIKLHLYYKELSNIPKLQGEKHRILVTLSFKYIYIPRIDILVIP